MDNQIISETDKIFATGVFLQPVKCKINGLEQWRWVAVDFEDDSFLDGKNINPSEFADKIEDLIIDNEE